MKIYRTRGLPFMKSKDRIIIQKIISYIDDVEKYVEGLDARNFFDDKKQ